MKANCVQKKKRIPFLFSIQKIVGMRLLNPFFPNVYICYRIVKILI